MKKVALTPTGHQAYLEDTCRTASIHEIMSKLNTLLVELRLVAERYNVSSDTVDVEEGIIPEKLEYYTQLEKELSAKVKYETLIIRSIETCDSIIRVDEVLLKKCISKKNKQKYRDKLANTRVSRDQHVSKLHDAKKATDECILSIVNKVEVYD